MKILITGAHFTPAQALIEKLNQNPDLEIIYVGRNTTIEGDKTQSIESKVLPALGVRFIPIIAGRLSRIPSIYSLFSIFKIPIGFIQAFWIVLKEQPDLSVSFGGYVSVPLVVSSFLQSVPILTHEQTLVMGLANKLNSIFADRVAVSFEKNLPQNEKKYILTGNPLRKELLVEDNESGEIKKFIQKHPGLPTIYVTGGNQGSHEINKAVETILDQLTQIATVVHQTGDSKFQDFERLVETRLTLKNSDRYLVKKWFDVSEVVSILRNSKLAITRGGANTLYELSYFKLPAIVIPLPFLYKDEQSVNAKFFKHAGLCQIIRQNELTGEKLLKTVKEVFSSYKNVKKQAENATSIVIPDASQKLAQEVLIMLQDHE